MKAFCKMLRALGLVGLSIFTIMARAEDIDIYTAGNFDSSLPNVIFVLDNTANWSGNNQGWGDLQQGQAEVRAIKSALQNLTGQVNVGLFEFRPKGCVDCGYVRFSLQAFNGAAQARFNGVLDRIFQNIGSDDEKRNSGAPYGDLMLDLYNYLSGRDSLGAGSGTPIFADAGGYSTSYSRFMSPFSSATLCTKTAIVFIGNPQSSGPTTDGLANSSVLKSLYASVNNAAPDRLSGDAVGSPLPIRVFSKKDNLLTDEENKTIGGSWNFDDWAKFLNLYGVPVSTGGDSKVQRHSISTYTIDVYKNQPNPEHSGLLHSAAQAGGGLYFVATTEDGIKLAIEKSLKGILAVNSSFAAASVPVQANDKVRRENEVFVGLFRPDPLARPRWFGNLKQYNLAYVGGVLSLVGQNGRPVTDSNKLVDECAISKWTTDSGKYWLNLGVTPSPRGTCMLVKKDNGELYDEFSDFPDGPFVEKGGAAQQLRSRASASSRVLKTVSGTALTPLSATHLGSETLYQYFIGSGKGGDGEVSPSSGLRASIHGDVVHSTPTAINYRGTTGTVVFYGSNDGLLRAVSAASGTELWGLIAPEHIPKIKRLYDNSPLVAYPNQSADARPKDYFFDGSLGHIVRYENQELVQAWIYPTMRRGGRMVYALDVKTPSSPKLLWRRGCLGETGCDEGFGDIGQTWSTPVAATVKDGAGAARQVVIFGGGYDACEDNKVAAVSCATARGRSVYVLDARTGEQLAKFATERSVVADVSVVDVNGDGFGDYAYAADMGGAVWRINLKPPAAKATVSSAWTFTKVAYTTGAARKFMHAPALVPFKGNIYVALGSGNRERPLATDYPYTSDIDDRFFVFLNDPRDDTVLNLDDSSKTTDSDKADLKCEDEGIAAGRGWFRRLLGRGEQVANPAMVVQGDVVFSTYRPGGAKVDMCVNSLGIGTDYRINLFNGSSCGNAPVEVVGAGMPTPGSFFIVEIADGKGGVEGAAVGIGGAAGFGKIRKLPRNERTERSIKYWVNEIDE